jgi:hypothetical protein
MRRAGQASLAARFAERITECFLDERAATRQLSPQAAVERRDRHADRYGLGAGLKGLLRELTRQQARELLAPVHGRFTESFDTLDLSETEALLDGSDGCPSNSKLSTFCCSA